MTKELYFLLLTAFAFSAVKTENTTNNTLSAIITYASGKIYEADTLDPEEFQLRKKRPHAQKYTGGNRVLNAFKIVPGKTQCHHRKYLEFFHEAETTNSTAIQVLKHTTIKYEDGKKYYFYDPEDLCVEVDIENKEPVIDIYKYDCSVHGTCSCGLYMSQIDPNVSPDLDGGEKKYYAVNGLNRKLIAEDGECVSNREGHCTLEGSKAKKVLRCSDMFECVLDDSFGPVLKNMKNEELYGICLPKKNAALIGDNVIAYDKLVNKGIILGSDLRLFSAFVILNRLLYFDH